VHRHASGDGARQSSLTTVVNTRCARQLVRARDVQRRGATLTIGESGPQRDDWYHAMAVRRSIRQGYLAVHSAAIILTDDTVRRSAAIDDAGAPGAAAAGSGEALALLFGSTVPVTSIL
jgi:hypothetical protein